jgi:hypothetical protein
MMKKANAEPDREIVAISAVYAALKELAPDAQARVLSYVAAKLKIEPAVSEGDLSPRKTLEDRRDVEANDGGAAAKQEPQDELEGISPVAKKWMARNGLEAGPLSAIFSLSTDEIDLIAKTVPGANKKEKMRSVFLLKGVAAYLASGAARFSHQQLKEACLHYDAFDANNFAHHFKSLSSEVSGSKDTEYALTPRGLASATEMVKKIIRPDRTN